MQHWVPGDLVASSLVVADLLKAGRAPSAKLSTMLTIAQNKRDFIDEGNLMDGTANNQV
jgi:hypothetical protein